MQVELLLHAEPIAQGRPRFSSHAGFVRAYDPKKSRDWKSFVSDHATRAMREQGFEKPLDGPLRVRARFAFSLPKSQWRKKTPREASYHIKRPDLDNLLKGVLDACEGVVFHRDAEISRVVMDKITVAQGEGPYVAVLFETLGDFSADSKSGSSSAQGSESSSAQG
jgi:Holliday junction resolvase RusA-like endonuclease